MRADVEREHILGCADGPVGRAEERKLVFRIVDHGIEVVGRDGRVRSCNDATLKGQCYKGQSKCN